MVAPVILVEAQPRNAANGAAVPLRLAGLGGHYPYFYGEQHYRAGIAGLPRTIASLDFDGEQLGGGGVPQAMELRWSPAGRALLAEAAALYWADAPITVRIGPEGDAMPPIAAAGLVLDAPVEGGGLRITLSDAAADLKKALLTDRFAGTGGIEGPVELEGIIKSRAWGRCFNVPGQLIDRAANVWCFGDPRHAWQRFVQVRDRGVALTAVQLLAWQGSAEATFAALKGAAVADGGVIVCPSIACVKLWTQATGDLKADIEGETAGGYVETAPEIVARLVAVRSIIPIAAGALAEAAAWRPAPSGWRIDNDTTTAADAISELLGDVSLSWLLIGGELRFRRWEWTASTRVARSHRVTRRSTVKPVGTRKLGYRRNWSPMARGDLAAIVLVTDLAYEDGTTFEELKPAQPGADVTGQNTAKDTAAVAGRPAEQIPAGIDANKAAVEQANRDVTAARTSLASDIVAARDETAKVRSDLSTSLSDVQGQAANARSEAATARSDAANVASGLSAEVDRAKGAEGALTTKVQTAQGRADAAYSAVTDETVNRAAADSAITGRVSTTEAQLRGDQDSVISARVRDEAAARASADSAAASRTGAVEARVGRVEGFAGGDLVRKGTFADGLPGDWPVGGYESRMIRPAAYGQTAPPNGEYVYLMRGYRDAFEGDAWIEGAWGGRSLRVTGYASGEFSAAHSAAGVMVRLADGSPTWIGVRAANARQTGYNRFDQSITIPAGATAIRPWLQNDGGAGDVANEVRLHSLSIRDDTRAESALAAVRDESAARASQDSAIAGRVSTTEAQLRGDQDSIIAARVRDEAAARAAQDSAIAGRITSVEARAGPTGNWLSNTALATMAGWPLTSNPNGGFASINGNGDDWRPSGENVLALNEYQVGSGFMELVSEPIAVEPGTWMQAYARTSNHRCNAWVSLFYYDGAGAWLGYAGENYSPNRNNGGRSLNGWSYTGVKRSKVPAGATSARLALRKYPTDEGPGHSVAWFTRPYVGPILETQDEWTPYTPGTGRASVAEAMARVTDEAATRADQDSAIAGRVATTEAQLRGDQDSAVAARVRDEAATRAAQDSAIAGRVATTEAQLRGDQDSVIAARVRDEAATRASQDSALAGRTSSLEANFSGAAGGNLAGRGTFKDASVSGWPDWPGAHFGSDPNMPANPGYPAFARFFRRDTLGQSIRRDWGGRRLRVRALLSAVETTHSIGAGFFVLNSSGQVTDYVLNRVSPGQAWSWVDYEYTCPVGAAEIRPWLQIDAFDNPGAGIVSYYELTDVTDLRYADAKISDEAAARSSQDSAIAGRVATTEAQFRGDQDSAIAARIRDEAAARAAQDSAIAGRVSTTEAQLRGDQDSVIAARVRDEAAARAAADSAISSRVSTTEARAGDLESRTAIIQTSVTDTTKKLEDARLEFSAITSGGRAALVIRSNKNSGAGIDLTGDLRVSGDVVVDGTFRPTKFDRSSMARDATSTWTGAVSAAVGQSYSLPWSLALGQLQPLGRLIYELTATIQTNAGTRELTDYNGRPLYTRYRDDGGLFVQTTDGQGNVYRARPNGSQLVAATSPFNATFSAVVQSGSYDSGYVDRGDYYEREVSATYTVTLVSLHATWVAI